MPSPKSQWHQSLRFCYSGRYPLAFRFFEGHQVLKDQLTVSMSRSSFSQFITWQLAASTYGIISVFVCSVSSEVDYLWCPFEHHPRLMDTAEQDNIVLLSFLRSSDHCTQPQVIQELFSVLLTFVEKLSFRHMVCGKLYFSRCFASPDHQFFSPAA